MKTLGQAIDEAIANHNSRFPESEVHSASVEESETESNVWWVSLRATHFSVPFSYKVTRE